MGETSFGDTLVDVVERFVNPGRGIHAPGDDGDRVGPGRRTAGSAVCPEAVFVAARTEAAVEVAGGIGADGAGNGKPLGRTGSATLQGEAGLVAVPVVPAQADGARGKRAAGECTRTRPALARDEEGGVVVGVGYITEPIRGDAIYGREQQGDEIVGTALGVDKGGQGGAAQGEGVAGGAVGRDKNAAEVGRRRRIGSAGRGRVVPGGSVPGDGGFVPVIGAVGHAVNVDGRGDAAILAVGRAGAHPGEAKGDAAGSGGQVGHVEAQEGFCRCGGGAMDANAAGCPVGAGVESGGGIGPAAQEGVLAVRLGHPGDAHQISVKQGRQGAKPVACHALMPAVDRVDRIGGGVKIIGRRRGVQYTVVIDQLPAGVEAGVFVEDHLHDLVVEGLDAIGVDRGGS